MKEEPGNGGDEEEERGERLEERMKVSVQTKRGRVVEEQR